MNGFLFNMPETAKYSGKTGKKNIERNEAAESPRLSFSGTGKMSFKVTFSLRKTALKLNKIF